MDKLKHNIRKLHLTSHGKDTSPKTKYPPPLSDEQLEIIVSSVKDWQLTHGSFLKLVNTDQDSTVLAHPVGSTLFPTLFPLSLFTQALTMQKTYNKLYARVAEDEEWLYENLKGDELARILSGIRKEAKTEEHQQGLTLGIWRNDYMLHAHAADELRLKQVEFNTISCAGGIHSNLVPDMHRHLQRSGAYPSPIDIHLPQNHTLSTLTSGLGAAHNAYGRPKSSEATRTCVLMIVQPRIFNVADERPIEYALWDAEVSTYRVEFPSQVLSHTSLSPSRELLFHCPGSTTPLEVSVVYFRAGFEAKECVGSGKEARVRLERSRAIKCPSILSHLTTFKKVQQALTNSENLDWFLCLEEATMI